MTDSLFETSEGLPVPAVTAGQMQEVDRIAVEEFGLSILQMMENAGRNLALNVIDVVGSEGTSPGRGLPSGGRPHKRGEVAILAGPGGNGGGGLCCARHLRNRGFQVSILLSKTPAELRGASAHQLRVLRAAGVEPADQARTDDVLRRSTLVVDALIGYSLRGAPRGRVAELIDGCNTYAPRVLSLDLPSGLNATTGETPGVVVKPERTLTLALPKTGLRDIAGALYLADIGIPPQVYRSMSLAFEWPVPSRYWMKLKL